MRVRLSRTGAERLAEAVSKIEPIAHLISGEEFRAMVLLPERCGLAGANEDQNNLILGVFTNIYK